MSNVLIDSYAPYLGTSGIGASNIYYTKKRGQTFKSIPITLSSSKFYMVSMSEGPGTICSRLYRMSGTYGVDGIPTGEALATSSIFDVDTLVPFEWGTLVEFNFTGSNRVRLDGGYYCITIEDIDCTAQTGPLIYYDGTGASLHSGNMVYNSSGTWESSNSIDTLFYVYGGEKKFPMPMFFKR